MLVGGPVEEAEVAAAAAAVGAAFPGLRTVVELLRTCETAPPYAAIEKVRRAGGPTATASGGSGRPPSARELIAAAATAAGGDSTPLEDSAGPEGATGSRRSVEPVLLRWLEALCAPEPPPPPPVAGGGGGGGGRRAPGAATRALTLLGVFDDVLLPRLRAALLAGGARAPRLGGLGWTAEEAAAAAASELGQAAAAGTCLQCTLGLLRTLAQVRRPWAVLSPRMKVCLLQVRESADVGV
jgi:hypothetical protein